MTRKEREAAKQNGIEINGHNAADHGDAGKEDF